VIPIKTHHQFTQVKTQSPYVRGGVLPNDTFMGHSVSTQATYVFPTDSEETPCGSSAGSGVAVAAGFAPVSLGAETDGSLVQPANRAALYAVKLTQGSVDMTGSQPGNPDLDTAGPLAKSTIDVLNLLNVLMKPSRERITVDQLPEDWTSLNVGFVNPHEWQPADFVTAPNEGFTAQSVSDPDAVCKTSAEWLTLTRFKSSTVQSRRSRKREPR
jgi:amidase